MYNSIKSYLKFLICVTVTITVTYFLPASVAYLWYILLLVLYWKSEDEPFWLAVFMTTVDGFAGFMGLYKVILRILPGLPGVELAQFYIILSAIKAYKKKEKPYIFYRNYLTILFIYLVFLIIWGQFMGFKGELRDYFRIAKLTVPFLLLYSIPRLFQNVDAYKRLFGFIFFILLTGFIAQLFTLFTGIVPLKTFVLSAEQITEAGGYEGGYRGFYNVGATLMGLFGALFFLSIKGNNQFNKIYLYTIVVFAYGMAYLSATRGWILSFGLIIILAVIFTIGFKSRRTYILILFSVFILIIGLTNDKLKSQIDFATGRFKTLEYLAEGDLTAGGTVKRLTIRGPRVMKVWKESPVFGWGFSDIQRKYNDGHVGNQNLLMLSGLAGYILLNGFLVFFGYKMLKKYYLTFSKSIYKKAFIVFVIFLVGWFIIHSTSGQHFNYMVIPMQIMPQAIFFSFGALIYSQTNYKNG